MKSIHRSHQNSQTFTSSRTVGQLVLPNQIISSTIPCPGCESSLYPAGSLILVTIISISHSSYFKFPKSINLIQIPWNFRIFIDFSAPPTSSSNSQFLQPAPTPSMASPMASPVARSPRHLPKRLSTQLQLRPCGSSLQAAAGLLLGGTNPRAEVPAARLNFWV